MAVAPGHKLGQMIGSELEAAINGRLAAISQEFNLYLDRQGPRPARGRKRKVSWEDRYGNSHDLDYVLEEGGTREVKGTPRAFIETAWRRYTKHSKNKAQELQSAILPLADTYANVKPFLGVVLAGEFTVSSLDQLSSHGFSIAYCPYATVVSAFRRVGVDISSEESSSDAELESKIQAMERLNKGKMVQVHNRILRLNNQRFDTFLGSLRANLTRQVQQITIWPLSGRSHQFGSVAGAVEFIDNNDERAPTSDFVRYEIEVRFSNGDDIRGRFGDRTGAIEFLRSYAP